MEGLVGAELALDFPDHVEEPRIHAGRLVGAPVAQGPVQLLQRSRILAAITLEGDGRLFLRVHVQDGDGAGVAIGDGVLRTADADERCGQGQAERQRMSRGWLRAGRRASCKRGECPAQSV